MLGEHARDRGREAAAPSAWQHEVADLDDLPLRVEVVEHARADDLAALDVASREREQPAGLREHRQVRKRGGQLVAPERGQVPGIAELRIAESRDERSTSSMLGKRRRTGPARRPSGGTDRPSGSCSGWLMACREIARLGRIPPSGNIRGYRLVE